LSIALTVPLIDSTFASAIAIATAESCRIAEMMLLSNRDHYGDIGALSASRHDIRGQRWLEI
jgi:hypothetical protein